MRPDFPERLDGIERARTHLRPFFHWYNHEHRRSGIGFMTPAAAHFGTALALQTQRAQVLQKAYRAHPECLRGKMPIPPVLPQIVGIKLPKTSIQMENTLDLRKSTPELLTRFSNQVSQPH